MTLEEKLQKAIDLLSEADFLLQEALPDSVQDECYNIHCSIELVIDEIHELNETMKENANG